MSTRAFIAKHKLLSIGGIGLLVVVLASILLTDLGSRIRRISDSTPCSAWSAANQAQQGAYAVLYLREHGSPPGGARNAASVLTAINDGCIQAFSFDEADTVDVLQAINHQY